MEETMRKVILGMCTLGLITSFNQGYAMDGTQGEGSKEAPHPASQPPENGSSPIQSLPRDLLEKVMGKNEKSASNKELADRTTVSQDVKNIVDPILDENFRKRIDHPFFIDLTVEGIDAHLLKYLKKAKAASERNPNRPVGVKLHIFKFEQEKWNQLRQFIEQEDPAYLAYIDELNVHKIESNDELAAILNIIPTLPHLKVVGLYIPTDSGDNLDFDIEELGEKLKNNTSVSTLILGAPHISNKTEKALATLIDENKALTTLELRGSMKIESSLAETLKKNNTLTTLRLISKELDDTTVNAIAEMLKENKTLTTLVLRASSVNDTQARNLAEALKKNDKLKNLELNINLIRDVGASTFAEMLKENRTLTNLNLSNNKIGDVGANAFAEMLKENWSLTNLNLNNNKIEDAGASSLREALKKNTTLKSLNLIHNDEMSSEIINKLNMADERIRIKPIPLFTGM